MGQKYPAWVLKRLLATESAGHLIPENVSALWEVSDNEQDFKSLVTKATSGQVDKEVIDWVNKNKQQ